MKFSETEKMIINLGRTNGKSADEITRCLMQYRGLLTPYRISLKILRKKGNIKK